MVRDYHLHGNTEETPATVPPLASFKQRKARAANGDEFINDGSDVEENCPSEVEPDCEFDIERDDESEAEQEGESEIEMDDGVACDDEPRTNDSDGEMDVDEDIINQDESGHSSTHQDMDQRTADLPLSIAGQSRLQVPFQTDNTTPPVANASDNRNEKQPGNPSSLTAPETRAGRKRKAKDISTILGVCNCGDHISEEQYADDSIACKRAGCETCRVSPISHECLNC
jgi:hypothetical protein